MTGAGASEPRAALVRVARCGHVEDDELVTRSYGGRAEPGWWDRIRPHSLGWAIARDDDGALVGFVNVAWDGGDHAFLLDPKVHPDYRRRALGTELVHAAALQAREAGCEWLHVDFEEPLARSTLDSCGFVSTSAGLLHLPDFEPPPARYPRVA